MEKLATKDVSAEIRETDDCALPGVEIRSSRNFVVRHSNGSLQCGKRALRSDHKGWECERIREDLQEARDLGEFAWRMKCSSTGSVAGALVGGKAGGWVAVVFAAGKASWSCGLVSDASL